MPKVEVNIEDLLLDLKNPRFEHLNSQKDALEKIIVSQGKKIANLADDIVIQGLSPAHTPLVIPSEVHRGKYVVLDGNRRITALKMLANPSLLDSMNGIGDITKNILRTLAAKFDRGTVEPITVYSCETAEEARHWIEAIHTGENEGRGVVGWDGVATARYRGQSASLKVLELIKVQGKLSDPEMRSLERFPITTLDRLLGTSEARAKIGLEWEAGEINSDLPLEELIRPLKRIVTDLANKTITVSHLKTKNERMEYINNLGNDLPDLAKRTGVVEPIEKYISANKQTDGPGGTTMAKPVTKALRKCLIPSDCKLTINNPKLEELYIELKKLPLEKYPNAIAALTRIFIELSLDHYGRKTLTGWSIDDSLKRKIELVANDLASKKTVHKRDLESFRRLATSTNSGLSIDRLHGAIHSSYTLPTAIELRKGWDEIQHIFEHVWAAIAI